MLGTPEVSALVKELEDQYYVASWGARNISHAFKKSVARVSVSDYRTVRSPLKQEVRPEDVVDLKEKDWAEMDDRDYDGDYIASTDPIHPVSTDYSHPLDDDDGSWIFNHFSSEELEASNNEEVVLDFDQAGWSWDNDNSETSIPILRSQEENHTLKIDEKDLIAWGSGAEAPPMCVDVSMNGLSMREKLEKEQIELIIEAFWTVVNDSTINTDYQPQQTTEDLSTLLYDLDITTRASKSPSSLSTPTELPSQWVDGSSEIPTLTITPASPLASPIKLSSLNSIRTVYNKQRKLLEQRLQDDADRTKYYSDLLLISRWEARAFEGPGGRFIPDPPMIRVHEDSKRAVPVRKGQPKSADNGCLEFQKSHVLSS
ncbi:hypothetical protein AA0113_g8627 [Alternaria arborescens]|uniref:Uncharacterized protein n=1 Tax=Alternaria arborescens TaxID=156630 RepID=A0A4Q4RGA7_9PLEO|nr:hypothetical protein AA0112_g3588 [Alternaria arborescens]RYO55690.1 hypothetical protein AA0113_g8627 [Alternaria arborescens]